MPVQELKFLGFLINFINMTIRLTDAKILCPLLKTLPLLLKLISTFPAIPYGKLHYCNLEKCKIEALKFHEGDFMAPVTIKPLVEKKLLW